MNYYICPLNLMLTEHYELKLLNFSLIDFQAVSLNASQTGDSNNGTMLRSQFKSEIKRVQDLLAGQKSKLGDIGIDAVDIENLETQLKDAGLSKETIDTFLDAKKGKGTGAMKTKIETADDYFEMAAKIKDVDRFALRGLMRCFTDLLPKTDAQTGKN